MGHVETYATLFTTGAISLTYLLGNKRILISQREKGADIKDYGEVALCDKQGRELRDDLLKVWTPKEATCLFTIALLRAAYGEIKNRDLELQYQTSFASEFYKGVPCQSLL